MPTLELPILPAYGYQYQQSPAWITTQSQTSVPAPLPPTSCQPGFNLCTEQGATKSVPMAITVKDINGVTQPVDITGYKFEFTAKTSPSVADTDPSTVKIDWTETNTPTQGTTSLVVPSNITATMQAIVYYYQVRMVQSPTSPSPIVTPLFSGTLTVIDPVSARY